MKSSRAVAIAMGMLASTATAHAAQSASPDQPIRCESIDLAGQDTLTCHQSAMGTVIAPKSEIDTVVNVLKAAADAYSAHFTAIPAPVLASIGENAKRRIATMQPPAGTLSFHWISRDDRKASIERAVRKNLETTLANSTPGEREEVIQKLLSKFFGGSDQASDIERGLLQHEFGHIWFIREIDGARTSGSGPEDNKRSYGSSAPDWLDETAAILCEPPASIESRRRNLKLALEQGTLLPLTEFLTASHPHQKQAQGAKGGVGTVTVRVQVNKPGEAAGDSFIPFYAQARAFADFLIEKSGDKTVFASIKNHFANGNDFDSWLQINGSRMGVGSDVQAVSRDWEAWLQERQRSQPGS